MEGHGLQIPDLPGLCVSQALADCEGNLALYRQLLSLLRQHNRTTVDDVQALLARGEGAEARRLAHSLKGSAAQVGAWELSEAARALELTIQRDARAVSEPLLATVEDRLADVLDAIRTLDAFLSAAAEDVVAPATGAQALPATGTNVLAASRATETSPKILIIDDEESDIAYLSALLSADYRLVTARSGAEGLRLAAAAGRPDLILLDILMPGLDGYAVCERLKADQSGREIPVVFVTAVTDVTDEARAFAAGAVDYITKPFNPMVVKARIKTHIELKQKTDLLERLATLDGLTSVANRRCFDQVLEVECARARRALTPLSLILIDVDHFKRYNDHYGHAAGDACLRRVAALLAGCLQRPADLLARYGGEEFAVLLPDTSTDGAWEVAERLRASVNEAAIPHADSPVAPRVTLSAGVACIHGSRPAPSPLDLVRAADAMLFRSKREGRDRVSLAPSLELITPVERPPPEE
jgi:diguanylate cyclase (GGDEF)-like protein